MFEKGYPMPVEATDDKLAAEGKKSPETTKKEVPQTMDGVIAKLEKKSKFKKESIDNKEVLISPEGEKFSIERITNPEDPRIEKLVEFTKKKLKEEEADTEEIVREALKYDIYIYTIIENEKGEIVHFTQGNYLEIESENEGSKADEAVVFLGYTMTDDNYQRKGLATEGNMKTLAIANDLAKKNEQKIASIMVEAVDGSEILGNELGLKRMYFETKDGNYSEVPYVQPPIEWDKKTGKPLDPKTGNPSDLPIKNFTVNEHLMVNMIGGKQKISVDQLLEMITPIYYDNYIPEHEYFPEYSKKASKRIESTVLGLLDKLEKELKKAKGKQVTMLSSKERQELIKRLSQEDKKMTEVNTEEKERLDETI